MLKILNQGLPAADTQIDPARNLYSERNSKPRIYDTGRDVAFVRAFASERILVNPTNYFVIFNQYLMVYVNPTL